MMDFLVWVFTKAMGGPILRKALSEKLGLTLSRSELRRIRRNKASVLREIAGQLSVHDGSSDHSQSYPGQFRGKSGVDEADPYKHTLTGLAKQTSFPVKTPRPSLNRRTLLSGSVCLSGVAFLLGAYYIIDRDPVFRLADVSSAEHLQWKVTESFRGSSKFIARGEDIHPTEWAQMNDRTVAKSAEKLANAGTVVMDLKTESRRSVEFDLSAQRKNIRGYGGDSIVIDYKLRESFPRKICLDASCQHMGNYPTPSAMRGATRPLFYTSPDCHQDNPIWYGAALVVRMGYEKARRPFDVQAIAGQPEFDVRFQTYLEKVAALDRETLAAEARSFRSLPMFFDTGVDGLHCGTVDWAKSQPQAWSEASVGRIELNEGQLDILSDDDEYMNPELGRGRISRIKRAVQNLYDKELGYTVRTLPIGDLEHLGEGDHWRPETPIFFGSESIFEFALIDHGVLQTELVQDAKGDVSGRNEFEVESLDEIAGSFRVGFTVYEDKYFLLSSQEHLKHYHENVDFVEDIGSWTRIVALNQPDAKYQISGYVVIRGRGSVEVEKTWSDTRFHWTFSGDCAAVRIHRDSAIVHEGKCQHTSDQIFD